MEEDGEGQRGRQEVRTGQVYLSADFFFLLAYEPLGAQNSPIKGRK